MHVVSGDIDTTLVIDKLNISEVKSTLIDVSMEVDTIILEYKAYACDCPDWNTNLEDTGTFLENHYYIDAATSNIELPWQVGVAGNKVKFIGKENEELGYPTNKKFQDPSPPKGKVFKYFSYELIKPYKVWAARKFDQIDPISGDSNFAPIKLEVR